MAAPTPSTRLRLRRNLHVVDYGILALAFTSLLVFLLYHAEDRLTGNEFAILRTIDVLLVTLYAAAFATKWLLADRPLGWIARNALNAFGVLPLTFPFLIPARYFLLVQVIVVILRAGEALDRAFGARVLRGLFDRYQYMVVEELTDPLLMRLAIVLEDAVTSQDYAAAIGKRLEARRDLIHQAVDRAIAASPKASRLAEFGPVDRYLKETTNEAVDAMVAALSGPEVNLIIREGLQDAFGELKQGIKDKKWREKGHGVKDVALGVVSSS